MVGAGAVEDLVGVAVVCCGEGDGVVVGGVEVDAVVGVLVGHFDVVGFSQLSLGKVGLVVKMKKFKLQLTAPAKAAVDIHPSWTLPPFSVLASVSDLRRREEG